MGRRKEDRYDLSEELWARSNGLEDMSEVVKELENMGARQWCMISGYGRLGISSSKSRAESERDRLREALGENVKDYILCVEPMKGMKGDRYTFIVERVK